MRMRKGDGRRSEIQAYEVLEMHLYLKHSELHAWCFYSLANKININTEFALYSMYFSSFFLISNKPPFVETASSE